MPENLMLSALKLLLALPVVILLAYISLRLSNKYLYRQNQIKAIQILERVPIHNKQFLCIVKIFDSYMVMGVSENNIELIKTLDCEEVNEYMSQKEQTDYLNKWSNYILQLAKRKNQHD
ncbi:MAG TPA: flagellar biosynthetic protein FliO [Clostridiales bacterium]|nr:flagellar biosynthetic protein FliO [Clostridiales bacterium]